MFQERCCFCGSTLKHEGVGRRGSGRPKPPRPLMTRPPACHTESDGPCWRLWGCILPRAYTSSLPSRSVKPFSQQTYTVQPSLPLPGGSAVNSSLPVTPLQLLPPGPRCLAAGKGTLNSRGNPSWEEARSRRRSSSWASTGAHPLALLR